MTLFEKIISRDIPAEIIFEDDLCIAFHDIDPQAPVHVLIVPKQPIARIGEATQEEAALLGHMLVKVREISDQLGVNSEEEGFRVVINNGKNGGESVPHLHIHLLAGRSLKWPPG